MKLKYLLFTIFASLSTIIASLFIYNIVHASGEQWYWHGTDTIRATGGEFGSAGIEFTSTNNNDSTNPEFRANIKNLNKGFPGGRSADGTKLGDDVMCIADTITIKVDNAAPRNNVDITSIKYKTSSGAMCTLVDEPKLHIPDGVMGNERGGDATEASQDRALEQERARLVNEYVTQQCGPSPTPECKQQAERSFNNQWEACMNRNAHLGAEKADEVISCVERYSGLDVNDDNVAAGTIEIPDYEKEKSSCSLEWIGYIICPAARFMAKITDKAFDALQSFLEIKSLARGTEGGDSLYNAWSAMRNVANALFVIAFMVVIYSQLTGAGITNYGIKKLLPRIIIAAILVNTSYYICVLAVELVNVLGSSIKAILDSLAANLNPNPPEEKSWESIVDDILVPTGILTAAAITITTAALYLSFAAMVPLLVSVLLSLLMVVILLAGRYALIIMLIVITPIAFVAFLLPNTQKWFNKWLSTFVTLLALYPIISLIYGGSTLASVIVMGSSGDRGSNDTLLPMFGLAIQALPLAITPIVMKFGGGVMNRFGGRIKNNGLFKGANSKAQGYADRKKDARDLKALQHIGPNARGGMGGLRDRAVQRQYKRKAIQDLRKGQLNRANSNYISGYTSQMEGGGGDEVSIYERAKAGILNVRREDDNPKYTPKNKGQKYAEALGAAGGDGSMDRAIANALNVQLHMHEEEVKANKMTLKNKMTGDDIKDIATGEGNHSEAVRQAAIELVAEQKDSDIDEVVKSSASMTGKQRHALVSSIRKNGNTAASPYYSSPTAMKNILQGTVTADNFTQQVVAPSINEGKLSAASIASAESSALKEIHNASHSPHTTAEGTSGLKDISTEALRNKYTAENIHPDARGHIDDIANGRAPRP